MKRPLKDIPASIHARLLNGAHQRREDFNLTLQRYAAERFLFRLGESRFQAQFILKGAMLFPLWGGAYYRATRDLDFTGYAEDNLQSLLESLREICAIPSPADGIEFILDTMRAEPIRDFSEYHGYRVRLEARLGTIRIRLQIDVGYGDAIEPSADDVQYPTLLDGPSPHIRAYPREAVVAEKLHAMVILGGANSRYKDFYDLAVLAHCFPFSGNRLLGAMIATFRRRKTDLAGPLPLALTPPFYEDPQRTGQWRRYLEKNAIGSPFTTFQENGAFLLSFLLPLWTDLVEGKPTDKQWPAGGPWQ